MAWWSAPIRRQHLRLEGQEDFLDQRDVEGECPRHTYQRG